MRKGWLVALPILAAVLGWCVHDALAAKKPDDNKRVFEWRIYTVLPGRMPAMQARFKDHTNGLLVKHGMTLVGFWNPQGAEAQTKLYYLVAHKSKETAQASWKAFVQDPDWIKARNDSEKDGKIVEKVESIWLDPTEYSALK